MKVTFLCPTRNKVNFVERAANSYLRQTVGDFELEIVFFDQASTDGTREILRRVVDSYDGPHTARILSCPDNGIGGTASGMNADINWVHQQIDGDIILWGNADDFAYPARALKTVAAFRDFGVSWVSCCQFFMDANLSIRGETQIPEKKTRRVGFAEAVEFQVGSSGALAYTRDLWDKHGPLRWIEQNDIVLPLMSFLEKGMAFVAEPLHTYVFHASPDNQGIGGRLMAAKTEAEKLQLQEVNAFNLSSNWMSVLQRLSEAAQAAPLDRSLSIDPATMSNINVKLWENLQAWEAARKALTLERIPPIGLHAKAPA